MVKIITSHAHTDTHDAIQHAVEHKAEIIYLSVVGFSHGFNAPEGAIPVILDADLMSEAELLQIRARFVRHGREIPK